MESRAKKETSANGSGSKTNEHGAALVEFALVTVLFFTIIFAIVQGGIIFGSWIIVTNAAREGARYASACVSRAELPQAPGDPATYYCGGDSGWGTNPTSRIEDYTKAKIAWPDPDDPDFAITITPTIDPVGDTPRLVRVRIDYTVPLLAPLLGVVIPNPLPLFAESDMRVEL